MIGFDTETFLIGPHTKVPRTVCVSLAGRGSAPKINGWVHEEGGLWCAVVHARDFDLQRDLFDVADLDDGRIVGHFTAYDILGTSECARRNGQKGGLSRWLRRVEAGQVYDTQVREKLIRLACGQREFWRGQKTAYDLASLVKVYIGEDISAEKSDPDAWRLRYGELYDTPVADWPRAALEYAALDAIYPILIAEQQLVSNPAFAEGHAEYGTEYDRRDIHDGEREVVTESREVAAQLALYAMSAWGLRTDPARVEATISEWAKASKHGRDIGAQAGFIRVLGRDKGKPGSLIKAKLQARVAHAFESAGLPVPMTGESDGAGGHTAPKGASDKWKPQIKVDGDTLDAAVALSKDTILEQYTDSTQATLYLSRYAAPLRLGTTGPICTRYEHLLNTGRVSASDPAVQQPPRKGNYRECHVPRRGYVYCSADYDFIELCALGQVQRWVIGTSRLADVINAGLDPHLNTAVAILRAGGRELSYDRARELLSIGDSIVTEARQHAKAANFGYPGMMGPRKFRVYAWKAMGLRFSQEQAQDLRNVWLAEYPETTAYWKWVEGQTEWDTIRQFVSGRVRGDVSGPAAANSYFQGLTADGAKYATWALFRAAYTGESPDGAPSEIQEACATYRGARPVLMLHDEIIAEVPAHRGHDCAHAQAEIMRWAMSLHIPEVKIGCKPVLTKRWIKGAKPKYENGRLVPSGG